QAAPDLLVAQHCGEVGHRRSASTGSALAAFVRAAARGLVPGGARARLAGPARLGRALRGELRPVLHAGDDLDGAARGLDLGARRGGDRVRAHGEPLVQLAVAEDLEQVRVLLLRGQAALDHRREVDRRARVERAVQVAHVDDRVDLAEVLVVDAALGDAADQRHLAAFPADAHRPAGTRLRALVATGRRLAVAAARAAADALARLVAQAEALRFVQVHWMLTPRRFSIVFLSRSRESASIVALTTFIGLVEP